MRILLSFILVGTALLTIIFSWTQFLLYPNIGNLAYLGWDPHLYRMVGVFFESQTAVAVYGLFFLYFLEKNFRNKLSLALAGIFFLMLILTVSRAGFVGIIITLLFYVLFTLRSKVILFGAVIIMALFLLIPKPQSEGLNILRTTSIENRLIDYGKAVKIFQKSPIIGIGYNHIRLEKDAMTEKPITEKFNPSHASASFHSSFLIILATMGIIGLGIYLWQLVEIAKVSSKIKYITLFLVVVSIFDNVLLHPFILLLLFTLLALESTTRHDHKLS